MEFTEAQRDAIAKILETVARDGLPGPRDLDVALDAIQSELATEATDDAA